MEVLEKGVMMADGSFFLGALTNSLLCGTASITALIKRNSGQHLCLSEFQSL